MQSLGHYNYLKNLINSLKEKQTCSFIGYIGALHQIEQIYRILSIIQKK